jgi:hypothetical protein
MQLSEYSRDWIASWIVRSLGMSWHTFVRCLSNVRGNVSGADTRNARTKANGRNTMVSNLNKVMIGAWSWCHMDVLVRVWAVWHRSAHSCVF